MASSPGRSTEPRTVTGVGTTSGAAGITFASGAITASDIGRPITGAGIPAGATLLARPSATTGTLSANATATATVPVTLGSNGATSTGYGFQGWSPETDAEASVYSIANGAGAAAPSVLSDAITRVNQRNR
jgi:hypothetical protein